MCRREAPSVEQFARDNGDRILVVGLSAAATLPEAQDFVATTGIESFRMVWSESFDAAAHLGVYAHPSWVLLSPSGQLVSTNSGLDVFHLPPWVFDPH